MNSQRLTIALGLVAAAAAVGGAPAGVQDGVALVRAADAKLYYPQDHGLRDIRADIEIEAKGDTAETTETTKLHYLWKSPGCERWMSLGEQPAVVESPGFFDVWAVAPVRRPLINAFAGCGELSVHKAGDNTVVSGKRVVGTVEERVELAISKGVPSGLTLTWRDKMIAISDIHYDERGGGLVPNRFKMKVREEGQTAELEVSLKHQKIEDFWLPESITLKAGRESARLSLGTCQINTGLPELTCRSLPGPVVSPAP